MKDLKVASQIYESIAAEIQSENSPVGIDAKKTHIIILDKLLKIEKRLESLEKKLAQQAPKSG